MNATWPNNYKFAFTIFDDTDSATLGNVKPIYDLLADLGMRTTKSVWVFKGQGVPWNGTTCEDQEYLEWVLSLQRHGFEIALHNVAPSTSPRERTRQGLDRFRELFGKQTLIHCNHGWCRENIYWGDARLSGWRRTAYNVLSRGSRRNIFRGHLEGDPLFWGDLCRESVRYVRNFVFDELNTLAVCPEMPYHDPDRPFVNYWFASAHGGSLKKFVRNFTFQKLDRLVAEGGLCIAYIHFALGFARHGTVDAEFRRRIEYIASKGGWFAPVSVILDYLRGGTDPVARTISPERRHRLETAWLANKILEDRS